MANYLVMFSAPRSHIEFMRENLRTAPDYYAGQPPYAEDEEEEPQPLSFLDRLLGRKAAPVAPLERPEAPADWPQEEPNVIDIEINHRNVDLYHWILNQTPKPVTGSGSIFQTWFHHEHAAVHLDDCNEDFAFLPEQLPELLTLVEAVTPERVEQAFRGWLKAKKKDHEPSIEEVEELHTGFVNFAQYLQQAIAQGHGLVWVVS